MDVELYMISVRYDHTTSPIDRKLPIVYIDIGDKIAKKNNNEWVVPNHYRSQNERVIRQIGVRLSNNKDIAAVSITSPDKTISSSFVYSSTYDIWYEPTYFSKMRHKGFYQFDSSSILTGLTNAGTVNLSYLEDDKLIDFASVHFIPSSISIEDYEEMVTDLYKIREDFVRDDRNIAKIGIHSNLVVMELQEQLRKLTNAIKQINSSPHVTLELQSKKKKPESNGRFDLRMEFEKYLNPGKPIYSGHDIVPIHATYENKLIKQMLLDLKHYANIQGTKESTTRLLVRNVSNELELHFKKSDLEIQRLLGSAQNVEDNSIFNLIHSRLLQETQHYIDEEEQIRKHVQTEADFSPKPNLKSGVEYVELTLELNGKFIRDNRYHHHQSSRGITAELKYDRRKQHFKVRDYQVHTNNRRISKVPNSHFGTIRVNSNHILTHIRFFRAFCEDTQQQSINQPKVIRICGFVRKQLNGIDAVSTPRPFDGYYNYMFEYEYISSIQINGNEIGINHDLKSQHAFLEHELPIMMHGAEQSEEAFMRLKQLEKLHSLTQQKEKILSSAKKYDKIKEAVSDLLKLPLFRSLELKERLSVIPTQIFLHNPTYRVAWQAIKGIKHELSASLYVQHHQRQVSTAKVEQIFEVWSLYKMLHILTNEMGWRINSFRDVSAYLDQYLLQNNENGLKNFTVTLNWQDWQVDISYEPKINISFEKYLTPDYVFKFKKQKKTMGIAILDAKYRNYSDQGTDQWVKDVIDIAISKYGGMVPIEPKWNAPILVSGILHCDATISANSEEKYNPYHVLYNGNLFNTHLNEEDSHKYSSIYMIPSKTYIFKNWFRLIMEYHIGEYKVCWNCGENNDIHERQLLTRGGFPKYYYTCNSCNEFWIKVHCFSNGHKIIKHIHNYHLQVENRRKWYVICPSCGDGRPKPSKEQLLEGATFHIKYEEDLPW